MTKYTGYCTAIITAIICFATISSCRKADDDKLRIGLSQCSADDWRAKMNAEVYREMMFHDDATVEIRSANDDNDQQIADIQYFIDNNFDIIIAAPNEAAPITPVIKKAFDAGIPVITFDRGIIGDSYTVHLEVDNTELGHSAAQYALNILPGTINAIEIQGAASMTPTQKRHSGFTDEMGQHSRANILTSVYGDWDSDRTARLTDSLLPLYPETNLIYAHNDRMAIAAAETARAHGRDDIRILGIDGSPEIGIKAVRDSIIDATFLYPTEGARLIRTAMAILHGEPYEREVKIPALSAVDLSNADILLKQYDMLNDETDKMKILKSEIDEYWSRHSAQSILLYAIAAILILTVGVVFLMLRVFWQNRRHRLDLLEKNRQLEQERDKQKELYQRLDTATQSKLMFFTNVSHDLRTPLTLIAEPIEQLSAPGPIDEARRTSLIDIARRNVLILRRLIDQILDFRKYENGKMSLNLSETDLGAYIRNRTEAFSDLAHRRHIRLITDTTAADDRFIAIDTEKIERVLFNLLSNAFKHTPDNGRIIVSAACDDSTATISVKDNGEGIEADEIGKIFDNFYQVDKVHPNGSGIGLALAKAFVELHGGCISVASDIGKGSEFTIQIPVRHTDTDAAPVAKGTQIPEAELTDDYKLPETSSDKPLLLIIDDNADIRRLVRTLLGDEYDIITAADGREGVRMAVRYTPDIIICDIMMPVMDGLDCCRTLKAEISTSHIPLLMLTACSMDEQRMQGYESGADGYLSKPFNADMLRARCRNLLDNRSRIRATFGTSKPTKKARPAKTAATDSGCGHIESEFYNRFIDILSAESHNPELSVETVAAKMGLGQSQFSRKIKALTNYTPVEIIRNFRLHQARELLTGTERSISEIAYEAGFTSPAYFSKCYKDFFGESPTELRTRLGI